MLLSEAANEPWIMDRPGRAHHRLVLTACAAAGFTPSIAHESSEWDTTALNALEDIASQRMAKPTPPTALETGT